MERQSKKNNRKRKRSGGNCSQKNKERLNDDHLSASSNYESRSKMLKVDLVIFNSPTKEEENADKQTGAANILETIVLSDESLNQSDSSAVSLICNVNSDQDLDDDELKIEIELNYVYVTEQDLLENIQSERQTMAAECGPEINITYFNINYEKIPKSNNIYIVIDTDILIDELDTINHILKIIFSDKTKPVMYLPWVLIQELDNIKDGHKVNFKFINDCLVAEKKNFIGELAMESANTAYQDISTEESILESCLRVAQQNITV